jgi:hypothetical protein
MKRLLCGGTLCMGLACCLVTFAGECSAADQRRVQHNTVACIERGYLKKALDGHGSGGRMPAESCIPLREGDTVVVEREAGPFAYVRPGGKVDHYWMPLEPVHWKKP